MTKKEIIESIPGISHTDSGMFFLLAGPCVVEGEEIVMRIAEQVTRITDRLKIPYVFKASYRKANRSKKDSFSGIGDMKAMDILCKVRSEFGIPVVTDIHSVSEAVIAAECADILQIPAFLCRQTDLLEAAGKTGKIVNIKKGQFLAAEGMVFAAEKVSDTGNSRIMLTERGNTFGYQDLVVDFRNLPTMQHTGFPVVMDITHSLQQPNMGCGVTGGRPDMIETIARAAISVGTDGLFIETHPDPSLAKSDGANMLNLSLLEPLLERLCRIKETVNKF